MAGRVGECLSVLRSHGIFWSCVVVFGAVNPWLHLTIHLSSEQSNIMSIFMFLFLPCSSSGEAIFHRERQSSTLQMAVALIPEHQLFLHQLFLHTAS